MEDNKEKFNLSNLVATSLLTGLLAIGVAHYIENKKRTMVEENLLAVVNDLVVWHKQRAELADSNEQLVRHLVGFNGVSKAAAEWAVGLDEKFKTRINTDPIAIEAIGSSITYDSIPSKQRR